MMQANITNHQAIKVEHVRSDFPILRREVRQNVPLIYLDSAATSQKPFPVIQAMDDFYRLHNANIHRGIHMLAEEATADYEAARKKISDFIGSISVKQVIFTRNATEAINLVAYSWGRKYLKAGDTIVLTEMEHHSNLVPWQILAAEIGLQLEFIPVTGDGLLDLDVLDELLKKDPRLVAFTHMSNVLGTINPAAEIIRRAHAAGARVLVDGAQSVPHFPVDVNALDVDFMAFSGHKMCGPTGVGVLYAKQDLLASMPPFLGGGDMIKRVQLRSFVPNELPYKFEAGTPAIAEAIGLGAAVDYLQTIGMDAIAQHEHEIVRYALQKLNEIPGVEVLGPGEDERGGVTAFTLSGIHPHDIAQVLDNYGIAIRAGHHCAMPLHDKFHIPASARASYYLYNRSSDIDFLVDAIYKVKDLFDV
jgi:cysteine desulfurase/selenocysteine lyase